MSNRNKRGQKSQAIQQSNKIPSAPPVQDPQIRIDGIVKENRREKFRIWLGIAGAFLTACIGFYFNYSQQQLTLAQNKMLQRQNELAATQAELAEAQRRSSADFDIPSIVRDVTELVKQRTGAVERWHKVNARLNELEKLGKIEDGQWNQLIHERAEHKALLLPINSDLAFRIISCCNSLQPYKVLDDKGALVGPFSPERTTLLKILASAPLDLSTIADGADFSNCFFQDCRLDGANLEGLKLRRCNFENVDLTGASLKNCDFEGSHFRSVTLVGTSFAGSFLPNPEFIDSKTLTTMNLDGAYVEEMDWLDRAELPAGTPSVATKWQLKPKLIDPRYLGGTKRMARVEGETCAIVVGYEIHRLRPGEASKPPGRFTRIEFGKFIPEPTKR